MGTPRQHRMREPQRGSVRARALRELSALTIRRVGAATPVNAATVPVVRQLLERGLRATAPTLGGTRIELVDDGDVRGEWVRGPKATREDIVVLYVHGGGFVAGSPRAYRGVTSRLSTALRAPVFGLAYRLAPEHPFPAAPHDLDAAYRWLLRCGYWPDQIVVAGDSAGGYLAADLVIANARAGLHEPAALMLFSPMADLSLSIAEVHDGAADEGILSMSVARAAVAHYLDGDGGPHDLRPAPGMSLPPTLIQASTTELLGGDAVVLADRFHRAGASCELQMWPDQIHVFQALPVVVPESRMAYRAAAQFLASTSGSVQRPAI